MIAHPAGGIEDAVRRSCSRRASASSCWSTRIQKDENSVPAATSSAGGEMRPARHQIAAEQQHAQKARFQGEGGQAFIGQQRRDDIGGGVGKAAPVGAELERHHHARDHAHAEGDGEDARPEAGDAETDVLAGDEIRCLPAARYRRQARRSAPAAGCARRSPRRTAGATGSSGSSVMPAILRLDRSRRAANAPNIPLGDEADATFHLVHDRAWRWRGRSAAPVSRMRSISAGSASSRRISLVDRLQLGHRQVGQRRS